MNHITGTAREQLIMFPDAIQDYISAENPVHFLNAFVDTLDMATLEFKHASTSTTGRPPYSPKDLLKLYLSQRDPFGIWLSQSHPLQPIIGTRIHTEP